MYYFIDSLVNKSLACDEFKIIATKVVVLK